MKQSYSINLTKVLGTVLHVGLLKKVSDAGSVSIFRWVGKISILLCWVCLKELAHYPVSLDQLWGSFKQPNRAESPSESFGTTEQQFKPSWLLYHVD